jgi:hypothetical protein
MGCVYPVFFIFVKFDMEERSAVFEIIMVQLFLTGAVLMSETEKGKGRSIPAFRFGCPSREQVSPP